MGVTQRARALALLVITALASAACGGTDAAPDASPVTITSTTTTATATPTATAAATTTATSTTTATTTTGPTPCVAPPDDEVVTASGRRVVLRTAGIDQQAPTVIVLHGFTGTPSGIERVADLTATATAAGVVVAYPQGMPAPIGGFAWNSGAEVFANVGVDDVAALMEMIDALSATGCVDIDRLTITGESNGGGMALATLCDPRLDGVFRSAVMVIPAVDDGVLTPCNEFIDRSVALTAVAGRIDRTTPFDGGNGLLAQPAWFAQIVDERGCSGVADAVSLTEFADRYAGQACGACTDLIAVADGPHTWPGSPETNGNLAAGTFDLNRRIIADVLAPDAGCLADR